MRTTTRWTMAAVVMAMLALALPASAAEDYSVPCSGRGGGVDGLRAAITAANRARGGNILLEPGCTYVLTKVDNVGGGGANGLPVIHAPMTIGAQSDRGPLGFLGIDIGLGGDDDGPARIVRSGEPRTPDFRLLDVGSEGSLTLSMVDLVGGRSTSSGAAIRSAGGDLRISYAKVEGNTVAAAAGVGTGAVAGGAIATTGKLALSYSHVVRNRAEGDTVVGGGVSAGSLTMSYSDIKANTAAGVAKGNGGGVATTGAVELRYSDVADNKLTVSAGPARGGGIDAEGAVKLDYSHVTGNTATGTPASAGGVYSKTKFSGSSYTTEKNAPTDCEAPGC
ncbi:MAG TPA: hypothetical protein VM030_11410 [Acidimicrobiales bacterium]|nr:hypothetical protein [Acidimicrobiales bacterium]